MTPELTAFINEAVNEGQTILTQEWDGMNTFAPDGQCLDTCTAFRVGLVSLLTNSGALSNAILTAANAPATPDLSPLLTVAQTAPPRTLYPIYRMLQGVLASNLPTQISAMVPQTTSVLGTVLQAKEGVCNFLVQNSTQVEDWAGGAEKLGEVLDGLGTILEKGGNIVTARTRFCLVFQFQDQTRATLTSMNAALTGLNLDVVSLDRPVSSRASQTSVEDVQTSLRGVQHDVSALLDAQGVRPGSPGGSLTMRVEIEEHLSTKEPALAVFYLPGSSGGLLETVREVVANILAEHVAAGYSVNDASRFLSRGDDAKLRYDYRTSYALYQQAYQKIVSGQRIQ